MQACIISLTAIVKMYSISSFIYFCFWRESEVMMLSKFHQKRPIIYKKRSTENAFCISFNFCVCIFFLPWVRLGLVVCSKKIDLAGLSSVINFLKVKYLKNIPKSHLFMYKKIGSKILLNLSESREIHVEKLVTAESKKTDFSNELNHLPKTINWKRFS